jgi:serine protease Do
MRATRWGLLTHAGWACWLAINVAAASLPAATPEDNSALEASETANESAVLETLPAVFSKPAPEGVDDLRAIESHVRTLIENLRDCTVGVQIGPAQGSGVIVTGDGYVLTAAHVSGRPGRRAEIIMPDGRRVAATTLGRDDTLDAGVMKIDEEGDWPHTDMAAADSVQAGDWCLATGHPGGFHEGRDPVFRLGRVIFASRRVLQSDCELVGGDSGGPLFDMHGRVIGINSRIGEDTELNFHVPVDAYSRNWARLADGESFRSHSGALLGVSGRPHDLGLEITQVYEDEPAGEAGVKVGDVLVTFGSRKVRDIEQLTEMVGRQVPGREVTLQLMREGESIELKVKLGFRWD